MLLTSTEVREQIRKRDEEKAAEEQALKRRKLDRVEKRAERVREAAVKAVRKAEREAAKAAGTAAKPPEAKQQQKRPLEAVGGADEDKENVSPNVSAAVAEAGTKPRYVCSVLRGSRGDVLRLRACV